MNYATNTTTGFSGASNTTWSFSFNVGPPRDDGLAGCYAILGVPPSAPPDVVRKAYRAKLQEIHPDHGGTDAAVRRVVEAYRRVAA